MKVSDILCRIIISAYTSILHGGMCSFGMQGTRSYDLQESGFFVCFYGNKPTIQCCLESATLKLRAPAWYPLWRPITWIYLGRLARRRSLPVAEQLLVRLEVVLGFVCLFGQGWEWRLAAVCPSCNIMLQRLMSCHHGSSSRIIRPTLSLCTAKYAALCQWCVCVWHRCSTGNSNAAATHRVTALRMIRIRRLEI